MELRLLICLAIAATFPLLAYSASDNTIYLDNVELGSGSVSDDEDIYIDGSGDYIGGDAEGSGDVDEVKPTGFQGSVPSAPTANSECVDNICWCTYDNGTKVPGTEVYSALAENCDQYAASELSMPSPTTTTTAATSLPSKDNESPAPEIRIVVNEPDPVIVVEYEPSTTKKEEPTVPKRSTTAKPKPTTQSKVAAGKDEPKEESKNEESKNLYLNSVDKEDLSANSSYISHPGILAAIIGGAIVGLLCAILLVMFIVYRMRKKDEGSYPLNDSKPLKDYAYSKAPSREFYA